MIGDDHKLLSFLIFTFRAVLRFRTDTTFLLALLHTYNFILTHMQNTGHMQHSNPDLTRNTSTTQAAAPALDGRHKDNEPKERKQVITYMSRAKKVRLSFSSTRNGADLRVRQAGGSTSGKSTSSGSSMGWNKDEQEWRKPKVKDRRPSPPAENEYG
jgi:hypothetical protein